ncbi:unnamed protein product [Leuciscus chuanchicus]
MEAELERTLLSMFSVDPQSKLLTPVAPLLSAGNSGQLSRTLLASAPAFRASHCEPKQQEACLLIPAEHGWSERSQHSRAVRPTEAHSSSSPYSLAPGEAG